MGAAARSKRSTAFAERLTVTRGTAFEPAEDMPPAAMGAVRVVAEAEETPAAYGLARPPLPPYSSVGGGSGVCVATGYSRVTVRSAAISSISCSASLWKGGRPETRTRVRAPAPAREGPARRRGGAARPGARVGAAHVAAFIVFRLGEKKRRSLTFRCSPRHASGGHQPRRRERGVVRPRVRCEVRATRAEGGARYSRGAKCSRALSNGWARGRAPPWQVRGCFLAPNRR